MVRRSNNRVTVEPLALKAANPTTESAIRAHGDKSVSARTTLDIYPEDLDQLKELFTSRGMELVLVIQEA
jgi:hypothetical protein